MLPYRAGRCLLLRGRPLPASSRSFSSTSQRCAVDLRQLAEQSNGDNQREIDSWGQDGSRTRERPGRVSAFFGGPVGQALAGTLVGVAVLGLGGIAYHNWYKYDVLQKMAIAFEPGYDPVLALDQASRDGRKDPSTYRPSFTSILGADGDEEVQGSFVIRRQEQELIDQIINGKIGGSYWLITGPKGTGKFSMICDAMARNQADGVAVCEAHEDPEVFRLRLGKCLLFEFSEDYIGGLFSRRDPREAGPLLDIERAMNKLEKVALKYRKEHGRPLVLVFNNIHLLHNDEESYTLLHLLQQRAEAWSQGGVLTMVFNSDDHWPYLALRKNASRMSVLTVRDLDRDATLQAIRSERRALWGEDVDPRDAEALWQLVGGRLSHLSQCVKHRDMVAAGQQLLAREKAWLLSQIGLIADCDDDVMDEQKYSSSSFLLLQALAKQADQNAAELGHESHEAAQPGVAYEDARQIMTRADFLPRLDHENIISIDIDHTVRADSPLMLRAIREICGRPGFEEKLNNVLERVSAIESLGRTRELIWKEGANGPGVMNIRLER